MKTILSLLLLSCAGFAQNLSLTNDISLGQNCGNGQHQTFTYQDVNLNGFTITLRNATLIVLGNLNGTGSVTKCGNQNNSFICVNGLIQNNPNLNGMTCQNLNVPEFELSPNNYGIMYSIFNLLGQKISQGFTNEKMFDRLPNDVLILKVEGFKTKKIKL
jgi:hypothetical protein